MSEQTTDKEREIERQQVEWVFGLTGGELSDEPWVVMTQPEHSDGTPVHTRDDGPPHDGFGEGGEYGPVFSEWAIRYWYEGTPDYAPAPRDEFYTQFRTMVQPGGMLSGPTRELYDGEGIWKHVATYGNSGETECPDRNSDDNKTVPGLCPACGQMVWRVDTTADGRIVGSCGDAFTKEKWENDPINKCSLCEEPQGEDHGYIYLGDGGYEAVYKLEEQHRLEVVVSNIGTVYRGFDRQAAEIAFNLFKAKSIDGEGRAAGESVTLLEAGEVEMEYIGKLAMDQEIE